jgi:anti-sigma regulatory factor (Ser/Thr protein kinase)
MDRMRLVLKPDELAPGKARARVSRLGSTLGPRHDDVVLVISELVTNCVRHSASDQAIEMTVDSSDTTIRIEVLDRGVGFVPIDSMRGGGLGLKIVDRVAANWGVFTNGHCTVWVEISKTLEMSASSDSGSAPFGLKATLPSG